MVSVVVVEGAGTVGVAAQPARSPVMNTATGSLVRVHVKCFTSRVAGSTVVMLSITFEYP